ncbi:MAG: hypothetical protein L3K25_17960 [Gammaproteobacteria bacterium]|nr:hypothetical protein [Gammaproteobacteria bacterium]
MKKKYCLRYIVSWIVVVGVGYFYENGKEYLLFIAGLTAAYLRDGKTNKDYIEQVIALRVWQIAAFVYYFFLVLMAIVKGVHFFLDVNIMVAVLIVAFPYLLAWVAGDLISCRASEKNGQ